MPRSIVEQPKQNSWLSATLVVAFIFLIFVGFTLFSEGNHDAAPFSGGGDALRQASFLGVFIALGLAWRTNHADNVIFPISLLIAIGWCWLSVTWAIEPGVAVRRIILATAIIASSYLAVSLVGAASFRRIFASSLAFMIVADIVSGLIVPGAVHAFDALDESIVGAWRGIHAEKNTSGPIAAVAIFVHFFLFVDTRRARHLLLVGLAAFFLWKTQSKTSITLAPIALMIGIYFRFWCRTPQMLLFSKLAISLAAVTALLFLYLDFDTVYNFLFDDPTSFTGRSEIWNVMLDYIKQHPVLGSGYGSFWNIGPDGPSSKHGGWVSDFVAVGHNGYLDVLAQTGAIGCGFTLFACIIIPIKHMLSRSDDEWRSNNAAWLSVIVFASFHNFQESSFMERDNPLWVCLLFAIFLSRSLPIPATSRNPARPREDTAYLGSAAAAPIQPALSNKFRGRL